jgi:prepilin-type N-terminal cleavage/methylation domain-containing protein
MARDRRHKSARGGYTLVELIIVVAIMALISGISLPGIIGGIQRRGVDGAARRLTEDVRLAQSTALTRGIQARMIIFNQSGVAANPGSSDITDTTKKNMYRIEMRNGPSASWPALTDYPGASSNVLTTWYPLDGDYKGVSVATGNTIIFNTQGFLANSASPLNVVLQGAAGTKTVVTSLIGRATIQ